MDIEGEDLYGEFSGVAADKKALEARATAAEAALATAQSEIAALKEAQEKLLAANRVYKHNLSVLFKTAQAEISRKNDTISELRTRNSSNRSRNSNSSSTHAAQRR